MLASVAHGVALSWLMHALLGGDGQVASDSPDRLLLRL